MATAPTAPMVDAWPQVSTGQVTFYWRLPASDGGDAITKYTLSCAAISYSQDVSATRLDFTVTGLTNKTDYVFQITATNGIGASPAATFPVVQPGATPFGPTVATASTLNTSTALVSWTPSTLATEGSLRAYSVQVIPSTPAISSYFITMFPFKSTMAIAGLSTNTYYQFLVRGVNDVGYCAPFAYTSTLGFGIVQTAFSPSSLTGMLMWYDAADTTTYSLTNTSTISSIRDKSGSGNNTYETGSQNGGVTTVLSNSLNNSNAFLFNGSWFYTRMSNVYQGQELTTFMVLSMSNISNTSMRLIGYGKRGVNDTNDATTATVYHNVYAASKPNFSLYRNDTTGTNFVSTIAYDSYFIGYAGIKPSTMYINANGGTPQAMGGPSGNLYISTVCIGQNLGGAYNTNEMYGRMAEVITYSQFVTPFDRQKVEGYLAWKWGLNANLPTTHPFKTAAPTSASVFSPSSFSSLQLWLDAADTTTLTGATAVSQWVDKSGRSNNVSQATVSQQPVRYTTSSGLTGLSFTQATGGTADTGGQWFRGTFGTAITNNTMSIFTVASMNSATQNYGRIVSLSATASNDFIGGAGGANMSRNVGTNAIWMQANGVTSDPGGSITLATPFIADSIFDGTTQYAIINGTQVGTRAFTANFNIARSGIGFQAYQGVTTTSDRWDGSINEVLVFNRALSTDDRQTVEGYLAWKWGLNGALPTTHPYKNTNPAGSNPIYQGLFLAIDSRNFTGATSSVTNLAVAPGTNTMSTNLITMSSIGYNGTQVSSFYFNATSNQYVATAFNMSNSLNSTMRYTETREIWVYYTGISGSLLSEHSGYPPVYDFNPTSQFRNTQLSLVNSSILVSYINPTNDSLTSTIAYSTLQYNRWHQIVTQFTQATTPTQVVYVNGQQVYSNAGLGARNGPDTYNVQPFYGISLGTATAYSPGGGTTAYFTGAVSIYRHYSTILTSSQVLYNYNYEKARFGLT